MNAVLAELMNVGQIGLAIGFVVFLRVGAAMAVLPAFGEQAVPQRVRLVLAVAFTVIVTPAVAVQVKPVVEAGGSMLLLLFGEVAVGLALGIALRMFVLVLQIAGSIAAQSTSLSQIFGTIALEPLPAIGHVMVISGLALAVMAGLHVRVAEAFIGSYIVFPPGIIPTPGIVADWGLDRIARSFELAFTLAAPFVIASFVYNIALGVINKAMPQLLVAFVGAPAITAGGLILLFLSLPVILSVWNAGVEAFLANPYGAGG